MGVVAALAVLVFLLLIESNGVPLAWPVALGAMVGWAVLVWIFSGRAQR